MTTPASPTLAPASAGVRSDNAPGSRFGNPGLPLDDASRRAGAIVDLGANPPGDECPQQGLARVKADLQAATADLDRLRDRLLIALNKGLVVYEMGAILDRLQALCQSIGDGTGSAPAAEAERRPGTSNGRSAARS
jgi:hypothetical protein